MRLLLICLGGALGTGARYGVGTLAARWLPPDFPYGTIGINVAGSFLIGVVQQVAFTHPGFPEIVRAALVIGFLGGFTTYSAFSYETLELAGRSGWPAAAYVGLTTALCLACCGAGVALGRALGPR